MNCPFNGKPCLHPKVVRLIQKDTDLQLHLCQLCSNKYLADKDINPINVTSENKLTSDGKLESRVISEKRIKPNLEEAKDKIKQEIKILEYDLKESIKKENYEKSALLRDAIAELEKKLN